MEFRSREKAIAMPNSFGFSAYASLNQESSAPKQLNLAAPPPPRDVVESRDEDANTIFTSTVNPQLHPQQHHHNNSNFHIQSNNPPPHHTHQQNAQRSRRGSDTTSGLITRPNHQDASPSNAVVAATTTTTTTTGGVRYRECLRNHAAHLAWHVVDGCGEFMPGGEEGTPESFKCAACDCHRNFHRKETDDEPSPPPPMPMTTGANCYLTYHPSKPITAKPRNMVSSGQPVANILQQPPQTQLHHHQTQQQQQRVSSASPRAAPAPYHGTMMGFGGGVPSESSSEDLNMFGERDEGRPSSDTYGGSRKRFRTKFTQDQKQKMTDFAEKLGWRIQKQEGAEVQQFCDEAGVKRQVFKVWMHNNKQAMKRKQS